MVIERNVDAAGPNEITINTLLLYVQLWCIYIPSQHSDVLDGDHEHKWVSVPHGLL